MVLEGLLLFGFGVHPPWHMDVEAADLASYRIDNWNEWISPTTLKPPEGLIELTDDGEMKLVYIRKFINAAANAKDFEHPDRKNKKLMVRGGFRNAGSNKTDGPNVIDGNPETWWSPNPKDPLDRWWIEIDLGRGVSATKVRLVFPDTTNVRPLSEFRVYVSDGVPAPKTVDLYNFHLAGRVSVPNTEKVVEFPLSYYYIGTQGRELAGGVEEGEVEVDFRTVQFVRVRVDSKAPNQALAEIEVETFGDNLALQAVARGGGIVGGEPAVNEPYRLIDGDLMYGPTMTFSPDAEWENTGAWFLLDLGAVFWVDRIHFLALDPDQWGKKMPYQTVNGFILKVSDGSPPPGGAIGSEPYKQFDFEQVANVENRETPPKFWFAVAFPARKTRYVFLRSAHGVMSLQRSYPAKLQEFQVFGEGYACEAVLQSPIIDLGERRGASGKNIIGVSWEEGAQDVTGNPVSGAVARVELHSRAGDTLKEAFRYRYRGREISREEYEKLKPSQKKRCEIDTMYVAGDDWDSWSEAYRYSGQRFLSKSPSRYVQLQVRLLSDDPDITPTLRSITLHYTDAFVGKVFGKVAPKSVPADVMVPFTYTLSSVYGYGDRGFDRVLIRTPSPVEPSTVSLRVNDVPVQPKSVVSTRDSLLVDLPGIVEAHRVTVRRGTIWKGGTSLVVQGDTVIVGRDTLSLHGVPLTVQGSTVTIAPNRVTVRGGSVVVADSTLLSGTLVIRGDSLTVHGDPVKVGFICRIKKNGQFFESFIGHSDQLGVWQRVDPDPGEKAATTVFLPSFSADTPLIGNVLITPRVLTPNGDDINDVASIRFSIFKVSEKAPSVRIYNLQGELVRELTAEQVQEPAYPTWKANWDGSDASGLIVLPGVYICRIEIDAESGDRSITRTVVVAY